MVSRHYDDSVMTGLHESCVAKSTFDGPITDLLSILCILIEVLSNPHAKGKSLNDFKFGTFIGRFLSEGAASMAVEELNYFA